MKILKFIIISALLIILILIVVLGFLAVQKKRRPKVDENEKITLYYWGLFEPEEVMLDLIKDYQTLHPNVTIVYTQKKYDDDLDNYKRLLFQRLKAGKGPNIFRIHSTWVFDFLSQMSFDNKAFDVREYKESFYPVMSRQCVSPKGNIVCIPIMYDGLVLYYNKDVFAENNITPPSTWGDLAVVANNLTTLDDRNNILYSGIAMGTANNVDYAPDILALMFEQSNVKVPDDLTSREAQIALQYYVNFTANRHNGVWSSNMPNSRIAFATNRSAMYFGKLADIYAIKRINPTLNIGMAPVPQLPTYSGNTVNKSWASYWVEAVSNDSTEEEQIAAWDFLKWLSEEQQQIKLNQLTKNINGVGNIPSNTKLYNSFRTIKYIGPVLDQAPVAVSTIMSDKSGNSDYTNVFNTMINSALNGKVKYALEEAQKDYATTLKAHKEDFR